MTAASDVSLVKNNYIRNRYSAIDLLFTAFIKPFSVFSLFYHFSLQIVAGATEAAEGKYGLTKTEGGWFFFSTEATGRVVLHARVVSTQSGFTTCC